MNGSPRRALIISGAVGSLLLVLCVVILAVDQRLFDRVIEAIASTQAQRRIHFDRLEIRAPAGHLTVTVDGLSVGSPPGIASEPLLVAPFLMARLRLAPLLVGRIEPSEVTLINPRLNLVRVGPGQTNYTFGPNRGSGLLEGMERLDVRGGVVTLSDLQRRLTFIGVFSENDVAVAPLPFVLAGGGAIDGGAYTAILRGARLGGRRPGVAYPFTVAVRKGETVIQISGMSGRPFDSRNLDIAVRARGRNLADVGYVLGLWTPNSPVFTLSAHVARNGRRLQLSHMVARVGSSDLQGEVASERRPGRPTVIRARLVSQQAHLRDLTSLLERRPPSGAIAIAPDATRRSHRPVPSGAPRGERRRARGSSRSEVDLDLDIARLLNGPLPISNLVAHATRRGGNWTIAPIRFESGHGRVEASARLELVTDPPSLSIKGALRAARLSELKRGAGGAIDGDMDVFFNLTGIGGSSRAMAETARGRLAFRVRHGRLQTAKAAVLSGDLVRAIESSLGAKSASMPIDCVVGEFDAANGQLRAHRLEMLTSAGLTSGAGTVSIPDGALALTLKGTPKARTLRLGAPIIVKGSLSRPVATMAAPSLGGRAGVSSTLATVKRSLSSVVSRVPPPAFLDCTRLLTEAERYPYGPLLSRSG